MIGCAVIGAGGAGGRRIKDLAGRSDIRLVALCDRSPERQRALARSHPAALVTDDPERAITAPGVDCVVVATPPGSHAALAGAALEAGRHVLVEKPLAVTLSDGIALSAAARSRGLALRTGANHRFFPPVEKARALIAAGALGPLRRVRARIGHDGRRLPEWARDPARAGGGALIDNGVHLADILAFFGVGSRSVIAVGTRDGAPIEHAGGGRLEFAEGPRVELWASWRVRSDYLVIAAEGDAGALWLRVGRAAALEVRGRVTERHDWDGALFRSWERDMDAFLDEVRGSAPRGRNDGLAPLMLIDALYRSAAEKRPVEVLLP
ncbi:MAG: Gfo/Idh/MocA family oxidoreductase [Myxococcales bacterium]|nr:Gfo/Idh/MocA family oxidoreductase [Myxococcales bacterium]